MRSLTRAQVWGRRLNRHALLQPRPKTDLVGVVRAVGGIHAQMMSAAELSIGARLAGVTREDVRAELWQHRRLGKTYGLSGTRSICFPPTRLRCGRRRYARILERARRDGLHSAV